MSVCLGRCGSQDPSRTADDPPAVFDGYRDALGRLVPACPCCGERLVVSSMTHHGMEQGIGDSRFGGQVLPEGATLWVDPQCKYDIVTLKSLKAN